MGTLHNDDGDDIPQSGVTIVLADCYFNIIGVTTTNSQGYYSLSVTLNGNSPYYLTTTHYRWKPEMKIAYSGGTYNFELDEGITEKIAVFFWAWDCTNEDSIDIFIQDLEDEGYTKFFKFANSVDVASDCETVDDYERDVDTVFTYVMGHGLYDGEKGHSYTYFKSLSQSKVYSDDFRSYMNTWDAPRKCLLAESCYSGTWADDFAASPYLAMSSADISHEAQFRDGYIRQEGKFSYRFFYKVNLDGTAVQAFNYAKGYCSAQYPQIRDYSSYVWFN